MSVSAGASEFVRAMGPVARELLGEPNAALSSRDELRFGSRGSFCVDLIKGTFFDNEVGKGGGLLDFVQGQKRLDKDGAKAWLQERGHIPKATSGRRQVAAYDYMRADGTPLFQVRRMEPKNFIQARADGTGGWICEPGCMKGVQLVPYRLPQIIEAINQRRTIYIAEGEKGVHSLESIGLVGTCSPGGAGKWRKHYNQTFAGADVIVLPDNDPQATTPEGEPRFHADGRPVLPGQDHAADVAKHLRGVARSVRVVMLPDLPLKGDVTDWVAAGGTREAMEALLPAPEADPEPHEDSEPAGNWTSQDEPPPPPSGEPSGANANQTAPTPKPAAKPWTAFLQLNDEGEAINNLANAMTALRSAPELRDCFRFDEMLQVPILVCPLPSRDPGILPRPVRDNDVSITQEWLQRNELRRLGKDIVHQAVALRAEENAFHPVRDYLNSLRWDRKPRLKVWLTKYAGCEPDEKLNDEEKALQRQYISAIGRMFLISMVARVMRPGCKVDYMLILESTQGEGKSTVGEILGGHWFSDSLPNIGSDPVRVSQHLRGKWLIEIGELSAMSKAETEDLKAFLTRKEEQFTPKYGRLEVTEPRQCVFMGTTNRSTYLRDETGARRFWPARAGIIDVIALTEDRDQLFAEAAHAYRSGEQWWPDRDFEKKFIQPQQEARRETDAWEQTIGDWLELPVEDGTQTSGIAQRTECTISEVAEKALRMEPGRLSRADQLRIAAALECLEWERGTRTMHGRPWVRRKKHDVHSDDAQ